MSFREKCRITCLEFTGKWCYAMFYNAVTERLSEVQILALPVTGWLPELKKIANYSLDPFIIRKGEFHNYCPVGWI